MDFLEFVLVLSLCVGLPSIVLYNIRKIREAKYLGKGEQEGSAMRTSELEVLIEDAVGRAVQPLHNRIDKLEGVVEPTKLLDSPASPLLGDEFAEFDDVEEALVPVGKTAIRS